MLRKFRSMSFARLPVSGVYTILCRKRSLFEDCSGKQMQRVHAKGVCSEIIGAENSYSGLSILNHWIRALLVAAMLTLGLTARSAPDPAKDYIMSIHIALGFFVLLFVVWRTVVRLHEGFPGHPDADAVTRICDGASGICRHRDSLRHSVSRCETTTPWLW